LQNRKKSVFRLIFCKKNSQIAFQIGPGKSQEVLGQEVLGPGTRQDRT
jgi:hypothetical protein